MTDDVEAGSKKEKGWRSSLDRIAGVVAVDRLCMVHALTGMIDDA